MMPATNKALAVFVKPADIKFVVNDLWYRIPLEKTPSELLDGQIRTLAFALREKDGRLVLRYFGTVKECKVLKRRDLLPNQLHHWNADNDYCKVELGDCQALPVPILGTAGQWFLTLPTTEAKLFSAKTINDLFDESPIEEIVHRILETQHIPFERQYRVTIDEETHFYLDFALFCRNGKLNIECDGKEYHTEDIDKEYDGLRDRILELHGWTVLRFTSRQLRYQLEEVVETVALTILDSGGILYPFPKFDSSV